MTGDNAAGLKGMLDQAERALSPTLPPVPNQPKTKATPFRIPEDLKTAAQEAAAADERYNGNLSAVVRDKLTEYVAERKQAK